MASFNPTTANMGKQMSIKHQRSKHSKRKIILSVLITMIFLALTIGLGVGVTQTQARRSSISSSVPTPKPVPTATTTSVSNIGPPAARWTPVVKSTWNYVLNKKKPMDSVDVDVVNIDLFDNDQATISGFQDNGVRVVCYLSGGSYEDWRSDAGSFTPSDLGDNLAGWPGENWLNTNSQNVRKIMLKRLDLAKQKGCDGVDPDNMDAYNNQNGLGLTKQDAINYVTFLASEAHNRGLAISLKNAGEIVSSVVDLVDFSVNESCVVYSECGTFSAFIKKSKPVFHVEYPKGVDVSNNRDVSTGDKNSACGSGGQLGFSSIIKNHSLDNWIQAC